MPRAGCDRDVPALFRVHMNHWSIHNQTDKTVLPECGLLLVLAV